MILNLSPTAPMARGLCEWLPWVCLCLCEMGVGHATACCDLASHPVRSCVDTHRLWGNDLLSFFFFGKTIKQFD